MDKLENKVAEGILDTRGAKTIISHDLAHDLNWEVETPSECKSFSSYLGLGGKLTQYFGCIPRPLELGLVWTLWSMSGKSR